MFRFLVVILSFCTVSVVSATEPDVKTIKNGLAQAFPGTEFDTLKVRPSQMPGLLEAEMGTTVFYVTPDGKFVLMGDMIDTQSRSNLSEKRRRTLTAKLLESIPEKNMIVIGPQNARRTLTVFTDVDCVYCRRMQTEDVPELNKNGVKVRYLLFPRTAPGSESYNRSISVWCASDRVKAVGDAMAGKEIATKTCTNPIADNLEMAEHLGVSGTPAIFFEDGRRLPGYTPARQVLTLLGLKEGASPKLP